MKIRAMLAYIILATTLLLIALMVIKLLNNFETEVRRFDPFPADKPIFALVEDSSLTEKEFVRQIKLHNFDVNQRNSSLSTPLHRAVIDNNNDILPLINLGAKINAQDADGNTPLHLAVIHDSPKVIKVLISNGALINISNSEGETPLYIAKYRKDHHYINGDLNYEVLINWHKNL